MGVCAHLYHYVMVSCVFVTFPYEVLVQVLCLIVWIPDLCLLSYFYLSQHLRSVSNLLSFDWPKHIFAGFRLLITNEVKRRTSVVGGKFEAKF